MQLLFVCICKNYTVTKIFTKLTAVAKTKIKIKNCRI